MPPLKLSIPTYPQTNLTQPVITNKVSLSSPRKGQTSLKELNWESRHEHPFGYSDDVSWIPYFGLGYERIFGEAGGGLFNPKAKIFIHNESGVWNGYSWGSLAVGLDFQGHLGKTRQAFSGGLAFRIHSSIVASDGGAFGFFELSFRGGLGGLNIKDKNGANYDGPYKILAADATLSGLGFYVGGGIRKEFWPQGQDENGQIVNPQGSKIFPTLTAGFGLL